MSTRHLDTYEGSYIGREGSLTVLVRHHRRDASALLHQR